MLIVFHVWIYFHFVLFGGCEEHKVGFVRTNFCHFKQRIEFDLIKAFDEINIVGRLACSRACMNDHTCFGFSHAINQSNPTAAFSKPGVCYLHQEYFTHEKCDKSNSESIHVYYRKYGVCYNGGTWDKVTKRCSCLTSTLLVGDYCTAHPRNCKDLSLAGYIPFEREVELKPLPNEEKVTVLCTVLEDGSTKTKLAFNRYAPHTQNHTLDKYINGFGYIGSPFFYWIGLKYMRGLLLTTGTPNKLSIVVSFLRQDVGVFGKMNILNARIGDASEGYRLTYSGHELTGGLVGFHRFCLQDSNGIRFSTHDFDRDGDGGQNCAALNGAGWWFNSCLSPCNLYGKKYIYQFPPYDRVKERYDVTMVRIADMTPYDIGYYMANTVLEIKA